MGYRVKAIYQDKQLKLSIHLWAKKLEVSEHTMMRWYKNGLRGQGLIDKAVSIRPARIRYAKAINQFLYSGKLAG